MDKIVWDFEKERFPDSVKSVLVCGNCGALIYNPRVESRDGSRVTDDLCDFCGLKYDKTGSKIHRLKERKVK